MRWDDDVVPFENLPAPWITVGCILFVLVLAGPVGGVNFTDEPPRLGTGNASVSVVEPESGSLTVTDGRFGTNISYLRVPDAVLEVNRFSGQPRVVYLLHIPNLTIDETAQRYVESTGRLTVPITDIALPGQVPAGTYTGRLEIRVQSFDYDEVVLNRSIEVTVE